MQRAYLQALLTLLLQVVLAGSTAAQSTSPAPAESSTVARARELVDTYYGNQTNLLEAATLLEHAHQTNPRDANVFVQAARITVMGGHIKFDTFDRGTFERYAALLDRAIELDPSNPKAHILKAQVFERNGEFGKQLNELERARASGTTDPWLEIGYARYFRNIRSLHNAYERYKEVERRGPGTTPSTRKAFVDAMSSLVKLEPLGEDRDAKIRQYAAAALAARYPTDAWTPQGLAEYFIDEQQFEEAARFAREALKTMNFGAGRLTLAAALYAQAAQMRLNRRPQRDISPLIAEARRFGFSKATVVEYLVERRGYGDSLKFLEPSLISIIP